MLEHAFKNSALKLCTDVNSTWWYHAWYTVIAQYWKDPQFLSKLAFPGMSWPLDSVVVSILIWDSVTNLYGYFLWVFWETNSKIQP